MHLTSIEIAYRFLLHANSFFLGTHDIIYSEYFILSHIYNISLENR